MNTDSTEAAWAAARAAEPDGMSRDEIAELLTDVRRARSWLDALEMRASRRMRELASTGRSEPAESMLANAGGHSGRDARSITERDELCEKMPAVEDALADGEVSAGYVDAMAAATRGLPEAVCAEFTARADELLARADRLSLDAFRRECRQLARHLLARSRAAEHVDELTAMRTASTIRRWVDRDTGMHHTHLELDPVRDARLHSLATAEFARLRAATESNDISWHELQVEAFVNAAAGIDTAVERAGSADAPGARRGGAVDRVPEITVLIDYDRLRGHVDTGICETEDGHPLPAATVRRLCCDAEIVPHVLGGPGELLDAGRSRRTATRPQRRALRTMHRGCAYPGCTIGFGNCRIHHVRWWWEHTGPTDVDNLLPLCEHHHHMVHEGGWTLTMTPDRVATWTRPDGAPHHRGTTIDRVDLLVPT